MYYQNLLKDFIEKTKAVLDENLVGIYLHGSMAMGCFNPEKSDIDLIIVVEETPEDGQKLEFMDFVVELDQQAPEKGLELSVVRRAVCSPFLYPTPFELHFSNTHLDWYRRDRLDYVEKMKGTDPDLAAHFAIINQYGIVLWGEPVKAVFGEVSRADYLDSIWYDVGNAPEDIAEAPVYVILNLCRACAYASEGKILSKAEGAKWGLEKLPAEYAGLISRALECYSAAGKPELDGKMQDVMEFHTQQERAAAQEFARYMLKQLKCIS